LPIDHSDLHIRLGHQHVDERKPRSARAHDQIIRFDDYVL
jgi:hypothetical protein